MPEISVVLPAKNEESSVGICIQKIQNVFKVHHIDGEIIVVDSSTDATPEIARNLGVHVVAPDKLGYGYAYRLGIAHAKGDLIVMGDADNTYDFSDILRLLTPLQKGSADIVLGSRFLGTIERGAMPLLHRYIGNPILTWVFNRANSSNLTDAHSGFRALTKHAYERIKGDLKTDGMEFATEMLEVALRKGLRVAEVPITYYPRIGESTLSSFADGWRHLRFILLRAPTLLFLIPGSLMFLLGFTLMILIWAPFDLWNIPNLGTHSMIASSLLTITGFQVTVMGLFAQIHHNRHGMKKVNGITTSLLTYLTLERGATLGLFIFFGGFLYTLYLLWNWIVSGFSNLPVLDQDIAALTLLVLGIQVFFNSFYLSVIGGEG